MKKISEEFIKLLVEHEKERLAKYKDGKDYYNVIRSEAKLGLLENIILSHNLDIEL